MDASRLLVVVTDIDSEYRGGLSQRLKDLIQHYTAARDAPAQDNSPTIRKALDALIDFADEGPFVEYPPSKAAVLDAIGGSKLVGHGLQQRLEAILSVGGSDNRRYCSGSQATAD